MTFPDVEFIRWAKHLPAARINLARSGVAPCPRRLLGLRARDLVISLPVRDGYAPLKTAIARRYGVTIPQVFTVSGGTSFADWLACAVALEGCARSTEVLVERPTYEPLLRAVESLGVTVRRFDRRHADGYAVDVDAFARLVNARTRLAIVTNLHNPSGARLDRATLQRMASALRRVGGSLLVDEVFLECLFGRRTESSVHAGPNVLAANSLTKAYGLDGLRAGWILGPRDLIDRAWRIQDVLANHGVAPGEQMSLAAFRRLPAIRAHVHRTLDRNLGCVRRFFERERRLDAVLPEGGNVVFPRLPRGVTGEALATHLLQRYSTLVVPGRFFESPDHVRLSFGCSTRRLHHGLANVSKALDDLI